MGGNQRNNNSTNTKSRNKDGSLTNHNQNEVKHNWAHTTRIELNEFDYTQNLRIASVIIGPRGVNHVRLQQETGCFLQIRAINGNQMEQKSADSEVHLHVRYDHPHQLEKLKQMIQEIITKAERVHMEATKWNADTLPPKLSSPPKNAVMCYFSIHYLVHAVPEVTTVNIFDKFKRFYGFELDRRLIGSPSCSLAAALLRIPCNMIILSDMETQQSVTNPLNLKENAIYRILSQWSRRLNCDSFVQTFYKVSANSRSGRGTQAELASTRQIANQPPPKTLPQCFSAGFKAPIPAAPPPGSRAAIATPYPHDGYAPKPTAAVPPVPQNIPIRPADSDFNSIIPQINQKISWLPRASFLRVQPDSEPGHELPVRMLIECIHYIVMRNFFESCHCMPVNLKDTIDAWDGVSLTDLFTFFEENFHLDLHSFKYENQTLPELLYKHAYPVILKIKWKVNNLYISLGSSYLDVDFQSIKC